MRRLLSALAVFASAAPALADEQPRQERLAISVGPFSGYLAQLDIHLTLLIVQPLIFEVMGFRATGSFWPAPNSLPRDGGGAAVCVRAPLFEKGRLEGLASGLVGYRAVLLRDSGFGGAEWFHGLLYEGVFELVFRLRPWLGLGLRGALGLIFFPGTEAPYFNFRWRLPVGGFTPEVQVNFEVVF